MKERRIQETGAPMEMMREIMVTRITMAGPMEAMTLLLTAILICLLVIPSSAAADRDFLMKITDCRITTLMAIAAASHIMGWFASSK